jgi:predicted TIM-barrel fold metal-dependent hydrolase
MFRRSFLGRFAGAMSALVAGRTGAAAQAPDRPARLEVRVGDLDLNDVPMVDTHVHPPQPMTLEQSYGLWNSSFVDAMVPDYDFPAKAELRAKLEKEFIAQIWNLPRQTGYNNYMARVHGVAPTLEGFDSVVSRHIGSDAAFARYVTSILDREKIAAVVFQARGPEPVHPTTYIPAGRFVWTYEMIHLVHPEWAQKNGATTIQDAVDRHGKILETAVANGCVGFKSAAAYYRPLGLRNVDAREADAALKKLLKATPAGHGAQNAPYYTEPALNEALRTYQDYVYKRIFAKAGELERPIVIHTAVALHPALRFEFNNPLAMYDVFQDDEIRKAATQFVLIHTGYPSHDVVAAMLSQFPNVYADMSFYSKFPGVLEETYRAFLALAPSEKIMHGSDSNNVPEEIGYCASNTRRVLARVLNDYRTHYGWTQADVNKMAENVMHRNARRVFHIST